MSRTYAASRPSSTSPSSPHGDVVDDPHPVPEPVRAAPLDGLPDRRQAERLARVDGEVGVLALEVLERVEVTGRREARLGAGDVEAGDAAVAPRDGELGDLHRAGLVPHRGEQLADHDAPVGGRDALVEALLDGRDDLVEGEPVADVLLGGVADLGVHDAVGGQVLDALAGHPGDPRGGLHDRDGVVEGLQVAHQRAAVGRLAEPPAQGVGVRGGQVVPALAGQLDDGLRPQSAVEVVVQQDLGGQADLVAARSSHPGILALRRRAVPPRLAGHAHLQHPRRGHRGGRQRDRHQRVAHHRPGPHHRVRRRDQRPPVDPRGRGARGERPVRRRPSPTASSPSACCRTSRRRCSASRRPARGSTTASRRSGSRTRCRSTAGCARTSASAPSPTWRRASS